MAKDLSSESPTVNAPAWIPPPLRRFIPWVIGPSIGLPSNYFCAVMALIMFLPMTIAALGPGYCLPLRIGLYCLGILALSATLVLLYQIRATHKQDLRIDVPFSMSFSVNVYRILRSDGLVAALPYFAVWVLVMMILYRYLVPFWDRRLQKQVKMMQEDNAK